MWQSFNNPTDTFLPGMKMDINLNLTSWKNVNDPSPGSYSFKKEESQYVIIKTDTDQYKLHWKSGSGSTKNFDPEPLFPNAYNLLSNSTERANESNSCKSNSDQRYKNLSCPNSIVYNTYSRLLMNHTGNIQYFSWSEDAKQWVLDWQVPKDYCSIYRVCGKFSLCSLTSVPECSCLPGFEPISSGDMSAGCKRRHEISCNDTDEFHNMTLITVENPTLPSFNAQNESECKARCISNCNSCAAYSYNPAKQELLRSGRPESTNRCWIWDLDLYTLQANGTHNISIRISQAGTSYKFKLLL